MQLANIETHIDELINYTSKIINTIAESKEVAALVFDDPDIDMSSDIAESIRDRIYNFDYIDDTVEDDGVVIMVDADIIRMSGPTIKNIDIYIQIVVGKHYMKIDPNKFPGCKGSRRDNIARQIDLLLNGSKEFGIGRLDLKSAITASVPKKFTSKMLTYSSVDYGVNRRLRRD